MDEGKAMGQEMKTSRVLVVDDEEINRKLMNKILESAGLQVELAKNGLEALDRIRTFNPDLIFLDIMMPDLDGFEVCRRIKEDAVFTHIPVVMVTSLMDRQSRLRGLDAGADDFVSKPVDAEELLARCRNLVKMKAYLDEISLKNEELEKLHKLKKDLTDMIVHDLRTPLTGILGNIELAMMRHPENEDIQKSLSQSEHSCDLLLKMINELLDISRMEEGRMQLTKTSIEVAGLFRKIAESFSPLARREAKKLMVDAAADIKVIADAGLLERILQNLVSNALRHVNKDVGEVSVSVSEIDGYAVFTVADNGEGIPAAYHEKIFDKFTRVQEDGLRMKTGKGLGLTFCKMAVEAHSGEIRVESEVGKGSRFIFTLPAGRRGLQK